MAVVPAGVHHAGRPGCERRVEELGDGQRVDIGAPGDRPPRLVAPKDADHAGPREARAHLEPGRLQPLRDDSGCPLLAERQLGVPMEVAAQRDQCVLSLADLVRPGSARRRTQHQRELRYLA